MYMNWSKIFFPVIDKFSSINKDDSDTIIISQNNWDLAHNKDDYKKIIEKIDENRKSQNEDESFSIIIIDKK